MDDAANVDNLVELTADIVSAYVANNQVDQNGLAELIGSVHGSLLNLSRPNAEKEPEPREPAVSIRKSVTPDYIICLEDGKKFKSLKRHLRTAYDMSPEQYRAKWGLPGDYPMVAPNYAASRSALAKSMGLGQQRRQDRTVEEPAAPAAEVAAGASPRKRSGRKQAG